MSRAGVGAFWRAGQRALLACAVAGVCVVVPAAAQQPETLPAGEGREVVRAKCLVCHDAELIVQQRLTRPGWVRELEKMERWGAVLTAGERATAADYLAQHFPQRGRASVAAAPAAPGASPDAGQSALERRCLGCHQSDLIEQQRLDRAGWGRELDKMVRWGAVVTDAERGDLLAYLAARFGQR